MILLFAEIWIGMVVSVYTLCHYGVIQFDSLLLDHYKFDAIQYGSGLLGCPLAHPAQVIITGSSRICTFSWVPNQSPESLQFLRFFCHTTACQVQIQQIPWARWFPTLWPSPQRNLHTKKVWLKRGMRVEVPVEALWLQSPESAIDLSMGDEGKS